MPDRPLEPTFQTWANDIARRLRAVERYKSRVDFPEPDAGGPYTITVAAANTVSPVKERADFICSGENDHVQIQNALDLAQAMPMFDNIVGNDVYSSGATVQLMSGRYNLGDNISMGTRTTLRGAGWSNTYLDGGFDILDKGSFGFDNTPSLVLTVEDLWIRGPNGETDGTGSVSLSAAGFETPLFVVRNVRAANISIGNSQGGFHIVENCYVIPQGSSGGIIDFTGAHVVFARGNHCGRITLGQGNVNLSRVVITDNTVEASGLSSPFYGIGVEAMSNTNDQRTYLLIADNEISLGSGTNTITGILVGGTNDDFVIKEGGIFHNRILSEPGASYRYGIWLQSATENCTVALNCIDSAATAEIQDDGTNNLDFVNQCGGPNPFGSGTIELLDEGVSQGNVDSLDFVGASVTATAVGTDGTVTITGGGREYATVVVAADDTHADGKASANFVSTGGNDTLVINNAILSLPSIDGFTRGRVLLLEGTYNIESLIEVSSLFDHDGMELRGMGWGTRLVQASAYGQEVMRVYANAANVTIGDLLIDCGDFTGGGLHTNGTVSNVVFENVCVLNSRDLGLINGASQAKILNCTVTGTDATLHKGINCSGEVADCYVNNVDVGIVGQYVHDNVVDVTNTAGIQCSGGLIANNQVWAAENGNGIEVLDFMTVCEGNKVSSAEHHGIYSNGGDSQIIKGNTVGDCGFDYACIYIDGASYVSTDEGPVVEGNSIDFPAGTGIICLKDNTIIAGNSIDGTSLHGIVLTGAKGCNVYGNRMYSGGTDSSDTYSGILLQLDSDENYIHGNKIWQSDYKYGIRINDAGCTANLVCDNDLLNSSVTADFSDLGTGTRDCGVTDPQPGWGSITNVTTDRAYDANATTVDELADALGTLVADLVAKGILAT